MASRGREGGASLGRRVTYTFAAVRSGLMTTSLFASGIGHLAMFPLGFLALYGLLAKKKALFATCLCAIAFLLLFVFAA